MAEWLLWIRDQRERPLPVQGVSSFIGFELHRRAVPLLLPPSVMVPPERHPGEWCLRVSHDRDPRRVVVPVLDRAKFDLLLCQLVRRHPGGKQ
jgi:hypothetical protein